MRRPGFSYVVAAALCLTAANDAKGQAWVLPRREGSISFTYQRIDNTGHRRTNGFLVPRGRSLDMSLYLEAEYAFTNRFSVTAAVPYVFAKYTDRNPPPPPIFLKMRVAAGNRAGKTSALPLAITSLAAHLVVLR